MDGKLVRFRQAGLKKGTDMNRLVELKVKNYRSLADVSVQTGPVNVLFGPNGAGKSTFLDVIWFVRDCAIRGVDLASSARSHGIGLLWDGADEDEPIWVALTTNEVVYQLVIGLSSGRIEPLLGENLYSNELQTTLIKRSAGSDEAVFYNSGMNESMRVPLREPDKLSLGRYLDFDQRIKTAADLDRLLRYVHSYHSRSFNLYAIKRRGSESSHETWLWPRANNLWSVLRNLHDKRSVDSRYDTIMSFMKEAFSSFEDVVLEQTGPTSVYASLLEKGHGQPILASGVSDGHLQMLILLTALFSEGQDRDSMLLLDEPETSLHPWALAVLAKAVNAASAEWNKQVFIATHSPVLISQFDPGQILACETKDGQAFLTRLSEMSEIQDLLEQYAPGSLYMANAVAPQGPSSGLGQ